MKKRLSRFMSGKKNAKLIEAAKSGNDLEVEAMLKKRADVDAQDKSGYSALIHASCHDHVNVVSGECKTHHYYASQIVILYCCCCVIVACSFHPLSCKRNLENTVLPGGNIAATQCRHRGPRGRRWLDRADWGGLHGPDKCSSFATESQGKR